MEDDYGIEEDENARLLGDLGSDWVGGMDPAPLFAHVEFLNLEKDQIFEKVQCRVGGHARQILENAVIQMKATFSNAQLCQIVGCVRREEEAARIVGDGNDYLLMKNEGEQMNLADNFIDPEHGPIPIPEVINGQECKTLRFFVDLGKVYSSQNFPIFKLVRTDTAVRNRFQLRIQLQFADREPSEWFESPVFRCRTRRNPTKPPPFMEIETSEPPPMVTDNVITNSLTARTAKIDDLVFGSAASSNADIAYHLKLKDDELGAELQEGDVVGFFTDDDCGETYVKLLSSKDCDTAVHAGVVSRSYYLSANKTPEDGKTDTVCVVGIVNVKVIGSVENGERVYASIDRPGKAIPQSHLPVGSFLRKKHVLLGMSMERKYPKSFEEEHLVKCFVCIVLDIGRQDVLKEVESIYEISEKSTQEQIKFASKKAWRRLKCCFLTTAIFVILLAFFLYQVFVPGSMFRYWLCSRGRITGDLRVSVTPYRAITEIIDVHGIRFTYARLKEKVSDDFNRNHNRAGEDFYYFLNLDRCAYYGDVGPVRDYSSGTYKSIGGGKVLSTNFNCSTVYWYGHHPNDTKPVSTWHPYISAQDLRCTPKPPY
ncbi:uncharacterized protein LOC114533890 [Dendronephthya gigantea]|uniref:uncharacterized protein LOC114533890 n=1 Tax=Dendronephthya gigantea TaxID=151771 RepID=UPI00106DC00F|nr:uncharacterized protein LOC114533890 [Dendronephthya gigantea]XP_028411317.1 uncharacterized protein LOC114533890 [Dendronephthya gigantea]